MTAVRQSLLNLKARVIAALQEAWATEPTAVSAAVAAAVVTLAASFGVVIPAQTAGVIVPILIPFLLAALVGRKGTTPVNAARAVALARIGSKRAVIGACLFRRTARKARDSAERLQRAAQAEEGLAARPWTALQALDAKYGGEVQPHTKLQIVKATHRERGRWVVLAS